MNGKGQDRIRENLEALVTMFENGGAPEALAYVSLPRDSVPCHRWSFGNRLLLMWSGTRDARGYRQWQQAGRHVKKGAKAVYILAPSLRVVGEEVKDAAGKVVEDKKQVLAGFRSVPVFRVEDTDGEPLPEPAAPPEPPPLSDVAEAWGIPVRYEFSGSGYYGAYDTKKREIGLATHEEQTFFHELAHAAQYRITPEQRSQAQRDRDEISAELAACVLMRVYGRKGPNEGKSFAYVQRYAGNVSGQKLGRVLWGIVADVEKIVKAIVGQHEGAASTAA